MIGICTDSSSQLPEALASRYGIEVVPVTVSIADQEYLEGIDIDADSVFELLNGTNECDLSVSPPSSGQFAAAYDDLVGRGCTEILSVHVNAASFGGFNAARLAAHSVPVPVRVVDSASVGFGISCCVWGAAEAVAAGSSLDEAGKLIDTFAPLIGNVHHLGPTIGAAGQCSFPVMTGLGDAIREVVSPSTAGEAVSAMRDLILGWGSELRIGIGVGHPRGAKLADTLERALAGVGDVVEVVRYRIGASFASQVRPETVSCFMFPAAAIHGRHEGDADGLI